MNIVRYNEVDDSSYISNLDVVGRSIMMRRALAILLSIIMMLTCYSPAFVSADKISSSSRDEKQRVTEVPEMRKPNSDTYLLSDGTYECVVYAEDKYFQDENGNYTKIDNTVEPVEYRNNANLYKFTNAANSVKVYFSDKKPSLLIKSGDETLAFSLVDSTAKTVRTGTKGNAYEFKDFDLRSDSCITYSEAQEHTDLVYSVQNDCVKEYIILKNSNAPSEYWFEFDTSNCTIKKNNSDRLCVYNRQGKQVFEFGSLFAVDSAGEFTDKMEYIVEKVSDQKTTIKVAFTSDYLDDTERVFPVLIDPSVMVTGANKTKDTFVSSRYPTANYYMQNWLRTGHDETYELRRTYIKFDLPDNVSNSNITSAYMRIKYHSGSTPEVKAYRVTKHWTPNTLTWENRPRYNTVNVSSGTYQASNDWYKIYVTDIVRSWYVGTYNNYGFVLRDDVESTTSHWTTFYSSDAASPNKPELHIYYEEYFGTRPYQQAPEGDGSNCMGYALEYKQYIDGNDLNFVKADLYGKTTAQILTFINSKAQIWMNANIGSKNYSRIAEYDSNINPGWYRVVLRVGFKDMNGNGVFDKSELCDYHWWYQTSENDGQWAEKQGEYASHRIPNSAGRNPASSTWSGLYNSSGIYYQVKDIRTINW